MSLRSLLAWPWIRGLTLILLGLLPSSQLRSDEPATAQTPSPRPLRPSAKPGDRAEYYQLLRLFADTVDQIDRNYVKDIGRRELIEAAIQGMLRRLDQYSDYISPAELAKFRREVDSEFGGIGVRVTTERGFLEVISPFYGGPAYKAGVMAGDRILRIDGQGTRDMTYTRAVQLLKGKPKSPIHLTILHHGDTAASEVSLKRAIVRVQTVLGHRRKKDHSWEHIVYQRPKIGYVRLTAFGKHTVDELRSVLTKLDQEKIQGVILDLRFNPGGLLSSAISVSDLFLSQGRIVSTKGRNVPAVHWDAKAKGTVRELPLVVLVNRFSASGSEIVAACLQDHRRAIIVGERTWGKGSVQNVIELESGRSAVKLTTATYHRPSGKNIHRFPGTPASDDWGVRPNDGFKLELSLMETRLLDAHRRQLEIIERTPGMDSGFSDKQLQRATQHLVASIRRSAKPRATSTSSGTRKRSSRRVFKRRR